MRDGNPDNQQNWELVCSCCAQQWRNTDTFETIEEHYKTEHPEELAAEGLNLNTVWVGKGPPPRRKPTAQRRPRPRR